MDETSLAPFRRSDGRTGRRPGSASRRPRIRASRAILLLALVLGSWGVVVLVALGIWALLF